MGINLWVVSKRWCPPLSFGICSLSLLLLLLLLLLSTLLVFYFVFNYRTVLISTHEFYGFFSPDSPPHPSVGMRGDQIIHLYPPVKRCSGFSCIMWKKMKYFFFGACLLGPPVLHPLQQCNVASSPPKQGVLLCAWKEKCVSVTQSQHRQGKGR